VNKGPDSGSDKNNITFVALFEEQVLLQLGRSLL
jgi:hypothetical protein